MPKIRLIDEKNAARHTSYFLPDEGSTIITEKIANSQYLKLCIASANENSTRIISLQSYHVICNFSKYTLNFYAFCMHRTEKFTFNEIVKLLTERVTPIRIVPNQPNSDNMYAIRIFSKFSNRRIVINCCCFFKSKHRFKGCGCPIFCFISQKTYKSINTTKDLNYYILVRCEGDSKNFSAPILINKPIIRTAFGMTTPQDTNVITHYTSN